MPKQSGSSARLNWNPGWGRWGPDREKEAGSGGLSAVWIFAAESRPQLIQSAALLGEASPAERLLQSSGREVSRLARAVALRWKRRGLPANAGTSTTKALTCFPQSCSTPVLAPTVITDCHTSPSNPLGTQGGIGARSQLFAERTILSLHHGVS